MNVSELNNYEKKIFSSIHNNILPQRKKNFDQKGILSTKNVEYKTKNTHNHYLILHSFLNFPFEI